ncbi:MAG: flagellar assembly factor FliW [Bacteroidota bacterium]|nr:flagellar assembly factor FliW [Bacteroidota bacterium]
MTENDMESESEIKVIDTLQFGEIQVQPQFIFNFPSGMLGFDDLRDFVLITEEETVPFKWLISMDNPEIGFPLLSPWLIDLSYEPGRFFDIQKDVIFVVVTLEDEKGYMTANLKAPVILDVESQVGSQVILPSDRYSPTHAISKK